MESSIRHQLRACALAAVTHIRGTPSSPGGRKELGRWGRNYGFVLYLNGYWFDFSEGTSGDVFDLFIGEYGGSAETEAKRFLKDEPEQPQYVHTRIKPDYRTVAKFAQRVWESAPLATDNHPYLRRKDVRAHGLRLSDKGKLIVNLGETLQFIDAEGNKRLLSGGRKKGNFYPIGLLRNGDNIAIAEGYATAATVYESSGISTVFAVDAGNLEPVAEKLRREYPGSHLLFAADNDRNQIGQDAAHKAAELVGNSSVHLPTKFGDWNDVGGFDASKPEISFPPLELVITPNRLPLQVAEGHLLQAVRWALGGDGETVRLIKGAAGLGKTQRMLERLAEMDSGSMGLSGTTWIVVPTVKLADEIVSRCEELGLTAFAPKGRRYGYEEGLQTPCERPEHISELTNLGIGNISQAACRAEDEDGNVLLCPYYENCRYQQQWPEGATVYAVTHEYLFTPMDEKKLPRPNRVIIDEDPTKAFLKQSKPYETERFETGDQIVDKALREIQAAFRSGNRQPFSASELKSLLKREVQPELEITPDLSTEEIIKIARPRNPAWKLLRLLAKEVEFDRPLRSVKYLDLPDGPKITMQFRRDLRLKKDTPVVVLDATADPSILSAALGREVEMTVIEPEQELLAHRVTGFSGSKRHFEQDTGAVEDISRAIRQLSGPGLLVTHKQVVPNIDIPEDWTAIHFGKLRGLDSWKDVETILIAGRMQAPAWAIEQQACALLYDSDQELLLTGDYEHRLVNSSLGIQRAFRHADPFIEGLRWQVTEGELLQAIGRGRPVHRSKPLEVYIANKVPLPIEFTDQVAWSSLCSRLAVGRRSSPYDRFRAAFEQANGLLILSAKHLAELFPEIWKTETMAKNDLSRSKGIELPVLEKTLNSEGNLFAYSGRWKGRPGRNTRVLSRFDRARTQRLLPSDFYLTD